MSFVFQNASLNSQTRDELGQRKPNAFLILRLERETIEQGRRRDRTPLL